MNLEQLRLKYTQGTTTTTAPSVEKDEEVNVAGLTGWFGKTASRTKDAASAVGGFMPATNRRVDDIAAKFNSRINNVEEKQWGQDVKIEMLAQLMGANLPSDEELKAAFEAEQNEKKVEATVDAVAPMMDKMMEMFTAMFGKVVGEEISVVTEEKPKKKFYRPTKQEKVVVDEDIVEIPEEVIEEPKPKEKAKPKKEEEAPKSGRRRIKRSAPLAD